MDDSTRKGSLPEGWIVRVSKNIPGRIYYFNVNTGCSTWECPRLDVHSTIKKEKSKSASTVGKKVSKNPAAVHLEAKSPEIKFKIDEFLSDAKRESLKRSSENETPSGSSKPSVPPTAIVTPVVLNKSVAPVTKKIKKKKPKNKTSSALLATSHTPAQSQSKTNLQRKNSDDSSKKVSFTIKSQNKIPVCKSQNAILPKSKNSTLIFKKKQSLVISVPSANKQSSTSLGREIRCVTLDKSTILPPSSSSNQQSNSTSKELLNRGPSLHHRFSSSQSRIGNQNSQVEKQNQLSSQKQLNENSKRKSDVLYGNSDEHLSISKSLVSYESDNEISDMDCEMTSDFEDLVVTVSPSEINVGASTSRSSDPDSDDIEMLDVSSSDLVSIEDIFGYEGSLVERYFITVDTNIFIHELPFIAEMKDTPVNGCGPPHFIIPWVVLQELDNLKRNGARPKPGGTKEAKTRKTYDLKKSATEAIRYLNALLRARHPRFHFQGPDEAKNCRKDFSRNNDDQLLECCLKLQKRLPKKKVILLTNDTNLANKAMVCEIVVHDRKSLLKSLKPDLTIKEDKQQQVSNPTFIPDPFRVLEEQKSLERKFQENHRKCDLEINNLMLAAKQILQDVLDPLFKKEMDEAYGDPWHLFKIDKHSLKGILHGFSRYWRSCFGLIFTKDIHAKFEFLKEKASRAEGFLGERVECLNILSTIHDILVVIKRKYPDFHVRLDKILEIKESTKVSFSNLSECEKSLNNIENALKQTEMSCCFEVFTHNWTVINYLCGCASDFCGIPYEFVYDKSAPFPPKSEFLRIMPNLYNTLGQLRDVMEVMLAVVKTSSLNGSVFKDLYKILVELVPSLNIQTPELRHSHFTPKLVERFCRQPENRTRIEEGYKQLLVYCEKLGRAVSVLNEMP